MPCNDTLLTFKAHDFRYKSVGRSVLSLLLILLAVSPSFAQISVSQNSNTQSLAQLLAGPGVTITNYTKVCDNNGTGTFTNSNTNLGLGEGVVMASGRVQNISQAANNFASTQFSNSNDPQLSSLTSGTIYDKCILEFDIVPQGSDLRFNYVFASEEYPEFVCSPYNDVFGFFISGPDPNGGSYANKNIATIPNSTTPVFINSVNPGISGTYNGNTWNSNNCQSLTNTGYYTNNLSPLNPNIVYDGMTVVLQAAAQVIPCQTYHLKLAIADVGDRIYDSGVFLEAYSFTSSAVSVSASAQLDYAGFTSAYEGCVGGTFTVSISSAQTVNDTVLLQISGSATNGIDYNTIPSYVVIPAGQTSVTIPLTPLQDGLSEPMEDVTIAAINPCTGAVVSSATLTIEDNIPISLSVGDSTLCRGQSTQLTATGGLAYLWTPAATLSSSNINNPIATPTATTTYSVLVSFGACSQSLSQTVYVSDPSVSVSANPTGIICNGDSAVLSSTVLNGVSPYTYLWSNSATTQNMIVTVGGNYVLTVTDAYSCSATASTTVNISNMQLNTSATDVSCFNGTNGTAAALASGGAGPYLYNWGGGITTASRNHLSAGTYSVTATDALGCSAITSVIISQPTAAVQAHASTNSITCFGENNGSVILTVNGGTAPYSFLWNNGATLQSPTNMLAGNYSVTVTDANTCTTTANAVITQPLAALSVVPTTDHVLCYGLPTGSIMLHVNGGTTPYFFNWSDGAVTASRSNLSAGTYTVTVSDSSACSVAATIQISQPAQPFSVHAAVANVGCYGDNSGTISLATANGTSPFIYHWNNNATSQNLLNIAVGNYSVTVTDGNACTAVATAYVNQPSAPLQLNMAITTPLCNGSADGSIQVNVSGGTLPYTYAWNNGNTTPHLANIDAGSYSITVSDSHSCTSTASANVAEPTAIKSMFSTSDAVCHGDHNGAISLSVSGGISPYEYQWNNGVASQNLSGIAAGVYTVSISDVNGCTAQQSVTIAEPIEALTASSNVSDVLCFGNNSGAIGLSVNGGTAPYQYLWSNSQTNQDISSLTAGNYKVTVTDAHACSVTSLGTVTQPSEALAVIGGVTNVLCHGNNTGEIQLSVSGGTAPYSYQWNSGQQTNGVHNMNAGIYRTTITDAHGCVVEITDTIQEPAASLMATATIGNVSCYQGINGTVQLNVSGGSAPYLYQWNDGNNSQNLFGVAAGNYQVTVTDTHQCSATVSAGVVQPSEALQVNAFSTNANCNGSADGAVQLTVSGGTPAYSYLWNNGFQQQNMMNAVAGNYSVTVSDANGCSSVIATSVAEPSPLTIHDFHGNVSCNGGDDGFFYITVSGGTMTYQYQWSNGATVPDLMNLAQGTYTLTVTDAHSCTAVLNAVLSQPAHPLNIYTNQTDVECNGAKTGAIQLSPVGGMAPYSYNWDNGMNTQNVSLLAAGAYAVTITDANYCTASAAASLSEPPGMSLTVNHSGVSCYGAQDGSIYVKAGGGFIPYLYHWSNNGATQNGQQLPAGIYTITVEDAHHCTAMASVNLSQPDPLEINTSVTDALCYGESSGAIDVTVSGGTPNYSYHWSNGSNDQDLQSIPSNNYSLTVTDAHSCTATVTAAVQQVPPILITESHIDALCFGSADASISTIPVGGFGNYQYSWSNGATTKNIYSLTAGLYVITVTDANSCTAERAIAVTEPDAIVIAESHNLPACNGFTDGTIALAVTGGTANYEYSWSTGDNTATITGVTIGVYAVTVTDVNHCTASLNAIVLALPDTVAVELEVSDVACAGANTGVILTSATGGSAPYLYQWSNGSIAKDLQQAAPGIYAVTVTDANGCTVVSSAFIHEVPALEVLAKADSLPCMEADGRIEITLFGGKAPYTFAWSNGSANQNLIQAHPGEYSVVITDANGCKLDTSFTIINLHSFQVQATGGGTVPLGETVQLQAVSNGSVLTDYAWTPEQGVNCVLCAHTIAQPADYTLYTVIATDTNGCKAQDTVSAEVIEDYSAFTPNAFTPNGDGNNDYFEFFGNKSGLKYFSIMIFDRWGEKVYESDNAYFKWDGIYKGELVQPGVFVYVLKLVFINGHADKIHKGSITVIR